MGGGGAHLTSHDCTQGWAEQRSTVHQLILYGTSRTTVLLTGRMGLAIHGPPSVRNRRDIGRDRGREKERDNGRVNVLP